MLILRLYPHSQVKTLAASTAIPVPAATPAKARLAPGSMGELVPAYNNGDQASPFCDSSGEQVLEGGGVPWA